MPSDLPELLAAAERVLGRMPAASAADLHFPEDRDAWEAATFVRDLLTLTPTDRVEATDGRHYRIMVRLSAAGHCIPVDLARRLAADLLRAAAQAEGGR